MVHSNDFYVLYFTFIVSQAALALNPSDGRWALSLSLNLNPNTFEFMSQWASDVNNQ